jgi:hypothetical protein
MDGDRMTSRGVHGTGPIPVTIFLLLLTASAFALPIPASPSSPEEAKPKRIHFAAGQSSAVIEDKVAPDADGDVKQSYLLNARAGQVLRLRLTSAEPAARLLLFCPGNGQTDAVGDLGGSFTLPQAGDYRILVTNRDDDQRRLGFSYTLSAAVEGKPRRVRADDFTGTYVRRDRNKSHVEVRLLPSGRIEFYLLALWGEWPNIGEMRGAMSLAGDTALFTDPGEPDIPRSSCDLTFTFAKERVHIDQKGGCGFGYGVDASGDYRRTSLCAAPRFDADPENFSR